MKNLKWFGRLVGFSAMIGSVATVALMQGTLPIAGIVMHLKLDEGNGVIASDASGSGNNGNLNGSTTAWAGSSSCKVNGCLRFNPTGTTGRVDVPNSSSLDTTSGFTVAFWYKAASNSGSIAAKPYGSGTLNSWQFEFSGGLSFTSSNGITQHFDTTAAPATNTWNFVTGTWDGATKKLYLNGVQKVSVARAIVFDTKAVVLGGDYNSGSFVLPFKGWVDEFRIFNRALSQAEITELYNETAGPPVPDTTPPVISGVSASTVTATSANIVWSTNEAADSRVEYGKISASDTSTPLDNTLVTSHSQSLTNLTPNSLYYYRVISRDAALNQSVSSDFTFTTEAPPSGFQESLFISGLFAPTAMAFAPDGRLFVAQQNGQLKVEKNGQLLATPFLTLNVDSTGERGLLGVAFDPDFTNNQYIYVYYTTASVPVHNRVSRFTAVGDTALPGSEVVLLDLDNLSTATNHNGGAIHFGSDGKLYIAVGDNALGSNAQTLTNLHGKILRINPDGTIPVNPFDAQTSGRNKAIWALGLRNPFTFSLQPGTNRFFINDVGQNNWEEINESYAGANYGWPGIEGNTGIPPVGPGTYRPPNYAYDHGGTAPNGCAITGGVFYNPTVAQFGNEYVGDYFFGDFCGNWIYRLNYNSAGTSYTVEQFSINANSPVDLKVDEMGNLYYLSYGSGQIRKISFVAGTAPEIVAHPQSATLFAGQSVTFNVSATGPALSYQWQRAESGGGFTDIPGAIFSEYTLSPVELSDHLDEFRVVVSNTAGSVLSDPAVLSVSANEPPAPILEITDGLRDGKFDAGTAISFSGSATDPDEGPLAEGRLTWQVDYLTTINGGDADGDNLPGITRPFIPPFSGVSGGVFTPAITGPYTLPDVAYVVKLTATDEHGSSALATQVVYPNISNITLQSVPAGLQLTRDGQPVTAPDTFASVVGFVRPIGVISPQTVGQNQYTFESWSNLGAATHDVVTPTADTTYTANFSVQALGPVTGPWFFPSGQAATSGGDNNGFQVSPENMLADDGAYATDINSGTNNNQSCTNSGKDKHLVRDFNLALPAGKTVVRGLEVRLDGMADSTSGAPKFCVQLSWNGGSSWTSAKSTPTLITTELTYVLGSAIDLWGRSSWSITQLNNTNFRVRISAVAGSTSRDFSLDVVGIRITAE